jgi:hypothetical protein
VPVDLGAMTEEEQLNYALQMSMAASAASDSTATTSNKEADTEMKEVTMIKI